MTLPVLCALALTGAARAATPLPSAACDRDLPTCDLATGRGCHAEPRVRAPDARLDPEPLAELERFARTCDIAWGGAKGCYETRVKDEVDGLIATSRALTELRSEALTLPDAVREACERAFPTRVQAAVDEAPAWCVLGRNECLAALQEAHKELEALPRWTLCLDRMQARIAENERIDRERAECRERIATIESAPDPEPTPEPAPTPALAPAPAPEPTPELAPAATPEPTPAPTPARTPRPAPAPARTPAPTLEVIELSRGRVIDPGPATFVPAPTPDSTVSRREEPAPETARDDRRKGQLEIGVTPFFSGVITVRDPKTGAVHRPNVASLGLGVDVVTTLTADLSLEFGLNARGAFGSTAVGQISDLEDLETETGTAFFVDIEPTVSLLSQYLGCAVVADFRWDSISVTSATHGLTSSKSAGGGGGLRILAGLGLLERDMRLVASLDWLFVATESTAIRAVIQGDIGPVMIIGAYRQHFRLGAATDGYLVDDLQLTLGYRGAF